MSYSANGNQYPSQSSTPQPQNAASSAQAYANLPPNILALIQQSANAPGYPQGTPPQIQNGPPGYNVPPASAMSGGNSGPYPYMVGQASLLTHENADNP